VFIENYASFTEDYFEDHCDVGLTFLMNNHLQLDLFRGLGKQEKRLDYFVSGGFSWRLPGRQ